MKKMIITIGVAGLMAMQGMAYGADQAVVQNDPGKPDLKKPSSAKKQPAPVQAQSDMSIPVPGDSAAGGASANGAKKGKQPPVLIFNPKKEPGVGR